MQSEKLDHYILDHISEEEPVLKELNRDTHLNILRPRMLSGHLQGQLLKMICTMTNPQYVLEIGTYTGYSAISMAMGLQTKTAHIDTIEINDELEPFIRKYIDKSGFSEKITLHIGSALNIVPRLNKKYDFIFMDGDKREYPAYYHLLFDFLNPGGYILADNILWDGKVAEPLQPNDDYTKGILDFNTLIKNDKRIEKVILPIRDGLFLIRKKHI